MWPPPEERQVLRALRDDERQLATRIDVTEKDIGKGVTALLARVAQPDDGRNLVAPRLGDDGTPRHDRDDRARVGAGDGLNELHVFRVQLQRASIATDPTNSDGTAALYSANLRAAGISSGSGCVGK